MTFDETIFAAVVCLRKCLSNLYPTYKYFLSNTSLPTRREEIRKIMQETLVVSVSFLAVARPVDSRATREI